MTLVFGLVVLALGLLLWLGALIQLATESPVVALLVFAASLWGGVLAARAAEDFPEFALWLMCIGMVAAIFAAPDDFVRGGRR